jgi:aspartyl-tRNA(Asn)/glutamyl-tRNA(Gln) amidotransferase subunit C
MGVDSKVVDYVASLAKLNLGSEERKTIAEQLGRILEYVDQLQEVDVDDVPPTKHVIDLFNVSRDDTPGESLPAARALENAPEASHGYFAVPKVLPD